MANDDTMPALFQTWGDDLSTGDIQMLGAIVADFAANGGGRVAIGLNTYARRLGLTAAGVELRVTRLANSGAVEVLERLRGAVIVRPLSRLPSSDFARAASRLRPPRVVRHRTRSAAPAA
jgi:hypothetical protein